MWVAMSSGKRKVLSIDDKAKIIRAVASGEKKKAVAERFGVPQSSLSTILKAKDTILASLQSGTSGQRKRLKLAAYEDVDKAVFTWFMSTRAQNVPVSGAVLQQKAKDFACMLGRDDFKASSGWLHRFKARHVIVGKVVSGESSSADASESAAWIAREMPELLERYAPADIYNGDETGLFYQMLPSRTLAVKGDRCHGGKQSKLRISVLLCVNMDGSDKRTPLVIGKSKKPRCLANSRKLNVTYTSNTKAWMTRDIFRTWLQTFDAEMKDAGRSVCLVLDNCSAHHVEDVELTNVELKFLPPNCTSLVQPLDQGIINSVKCAYRKRVIDKLLLDLHLKRPTKVDIYQAMEMLSASWTATSKETVVNCFRKAGFHDLEGATGAGTASGGVHQEDDDMANDQALHAAWRNLQGDGAAPDNVELDDYLYADSAVIATEEMTDEAIASSVRGDMEDENDSDEPDGPDTCDVPSSREVADAIDVLRRFAGSQQDEDVMQAVWLCERRVTPLLMSRVAQKKVTDYFQPK